MPLTLSHVQTRMLRSPRVLNQALISFSFIFRSFEDEDSDVSSQKYASGFLNCSYETLFLKSLPTKSCLLIYVAPLARLGNEQGLSNSKKVTPIEDFLCRNREKICIYIYMPLTIYVYTFETSPPWMIESSLK